MTPKEKAKELVDKIDEATTYILPRHVVKQLATIVVDEVIDSMSEYDNLIEEDLKDEFGIEFYSSQLQNMESDFRYWSKVENEIEKL